MTTGPIVSQKVSMGHAFGVGARFRWVLESRDVACWIHRESIIGFAFKVVGNDVVITHDGRRATTLRGAAADQFLADAEVGDSQPAMARLTGNYKRGNGRTAKNHPHDHGA